MPRTRTSTRPTARAISRHWTRTATRSRKTSAHTKADLLDSYGFSEWVGPEAHGLGKQNTGTARDPFTADETIALLKRLDQDENKQPWPTVCSFLNPHDISMFGVIALAQGLRYDTGSIPSIPEPPTQSEDLSTKPSCQQSYVDAWGKILAPQPLIETHRRFYYQLQRTVDEQIGRVLNALRATRAYENTIVIFSSDHGDMLGAHGGMHEKWHNAYEKTIHVPFVAASPLFPGGRCEDGIPTSHADLLPTLLGLAGIDCDAAFKRVAAEHTEARPLVGRDLSGLIRGTGGQPPSDPVLFITDDRSVRVAQSLVAHCSGLPASSGPMSGSSNRTTLRRSLRKSRSTVSSISSSCRATTITNSSGRYPACATSVSTAGRKPSR